MKHFLKILVVVMISIPACGFAQGQPALQKPLAVSKVSKVGGEGGFDYVYADADGRKLYIARTGEGGRVSVYNLDTLEPAGEIAHVNARGVAVDPVSRHGFASSKPLAMWDTGTLSLIKSIDVQGAPDGILFDPYNERVWVFSHKAPNATVVDGKTGEVVGTMDLGGAPEQAASDGKGRLYVDIEDKDAVAVVDAAGLKVLATYDISAQGKGPGGLALDPKNGILFASCHNPAIMVVLEAATGKTLAALPIGKGTDGALFDPATMEAYSSNGADGTLTVVKENSPSDFVVEQTLPTLPGARTSTLDRETSRIFLITAEFGPAPSPPPNGGWVRRPMIPGTFTILRVSR
jgi:DNA-binding beta-propeller fold protein YncE